MYYFYMLANKNHGALYVGVTNDLVRRTYEHKEHVLPGFTSKYNIHKLVYYEVFEDINRAIEREKQVKTWNRAWKEHLISKFNPNWNDLYDELTGL